MTTINISDIKMYLKPDLVIGKGGEADIYMLPNMLSNKKMVAKIFKPPNHPDLLTAEDRLNAKNKLKEHQSKLPSFPTVWPKEVIVPKSLIINTKQEIVGYTMDYVDNGEPLIRYSEKPYRQYIPNNNVVKLFRKIHKTVSNIHNINVVIGDFNDLNVIISNDIPYFLDADSFQFGQFLCRMFTTRFVDPLLCDTNSDHLMLIKPYNYNSDWYIFNTLLMQSLLFVGPYGGIYFLPNTKKILNADKRVLERITVFNSEVRYPRPAIHYNILPDELLNQFDLVFQKDRRGTFPLNLLDMRWTKCRVCGTEHAKAMCPNCAKTAPIAVKATKIVYEHIVLTQVFKTPGTILFANAQDGKLNWLYWDKKKFQRETGNVIAEDNLDPQTRYRIWGEQTLFGKRGAVNVFDQKGLIKKVPTDSFGNLPMFDANQNNMFWLESGRLLKNGKFGNDFIGNVLKNQTLFWVGKSFGFGFYRAGVINIAFVFNTEGSGIKDDVKIPQINGTLIDSTCVFSSEMCWFFVATQEGPRIFHYCFVISKQGNILSSFKEEKRDGSWFSSLRGKCAVGNFLFSPSDEGIIRLGILNGQITEERRFKDTEKFVDSGSYIFTGKEGLYVVGSQEIVLLQM